MSSLLLSLESKAHLEMKLEAVQMQIKCGEYPDLIDGQLRWLLNHAIEAGYAQCIADQKRQMDVEIENVHKQQAEFRALAEKRRSA